MYCIYRCSNPFQILSLEFIPEIFLKFRKFQPQYSNKIYSYGKKAYGVATCLHTCLIHINTNVSIVLLARSINEKGRIYQKNLPKLN